MAAIRPRQAMALLVATALAAAVWLTVRDPAGGEPRKGVVLAPGAMATAANPATAGPDPRFLSPRPGADAEAPQPPPLLVHGLRDSLEALLLEAMESGATHDPAALKRRLAALVDQHFSAEVRERALDLAQRYVDYRAAVARLKPPAEMANPQAVRASLQARDLLRQHFFASAETEALFGTESVLDQHTLARLDIVGDTARTTDQKTQALRAAEEALPEPLRAARQSYTAHLAAAEQTAALDARNADGATRFAERSARYGATAATALARLDGEEQQWQRRLDLYAQARASQGDGAAGQRLRQQLFSAEEQLRVDAALALRAARAASPATVAGG